MNKKFIAIVFVLIFIVCIGLIYFMNPEENTYIKYKDFTLKLEGGLIEKADIKDDKVFFKMISDETIYYTENPDYDSFKEYLLLNDVKVENTFDSESFVFIFDLLFYSIFIAAACYGVYKVLAFSTKNFKIIKTNKIKFSDIVGMEDIKKDLVKVTDILKNPSAYREKGIRPPKGIILEGPPGNGKTLLARAIAGEGNINFIPTKGADFQSAMMSVGPYKIKSLFKKARKNKPCIIFIDEFDGIGERRNYAGTGIDKENNRLIISMLNEMDGFEGEDGVLVIAATNSYASLDGALVRPGRFDVKYKIDNPNKETIIDLISMYTKNKKLDSKIRMQELAKCFEKLSAAAIETIINEAMLIAVMNGRDVITIQDISEAGIKTGTVNIKVCN